MARIVWLLLMMHLASACSTTAEPTSMAAATLPEDLPPDPVIYQRELSDVPLASCQTLAENCPSEERKLPYHCVAYRLAGELLWKDSRIYAWGPSLCQARHSLLVQACDQNKDPTQLSDIHCGPDSSSGACPPIIKNCPSQGSPSRCIANRYKNLEIPWSERPISWSANECIARQQLLTKACQQGLDPNDIGDISCEADPTPGSCPAPTPICAETPSVPTSCQVSTIGDITLKQPWVATGTTACEAQYRLKELACRFTDAAKKLTPEQLGSMECRSLIALP